MGMFNKQAPEAKSSGSRRPSSSRSNKDSERKVRSSVRSKDLKVTYENVIGSISGYEENDLDKESVVRFVRSIYNWMVFDADMQLDLPVPSGSTKVMKMWPHGAKVDSRRKSVSNYGEKSSRRLMDLDEDAVIGIASSVVSSALDEDRSVKSKGEVMFETPRGHIYSPGGHRSGPGESYMQSSQYGSCVPGGPPMGYQEHNRPSRIVPEGFQPVSAAPRSIPRYSVVAGTAPPMHVQETPELRQAVPQHKKKGKKTRVGAASRDAEDDDGVPVIFAD